MVKFTEEQHKYTHSEIRYLSVSKLISKFKQPFQKKYWASYKTLEAMVPVDIFYYYKNKYGRNFVWLLAHTVDQEEFEKNKQDLINKWAADNKKAVNTGNKFHYKKEDESYELGTEINLTDGKTYNVFKKERIKNVNESLTENLLDLEEGFYPELLVWNHKYKLAGQADKVYITEDKHIDIGDYKTNKAIKKENPFQSMKGALGHLDDCNYNHYCLQISCYAWMLEQFGFTVRDLSFDHYARGEEEAVRYNLPYLREEVEIMLSTL